MKLKVLSDRDGQILALAQLPEGGDVTFGFEATPGQDVHEISLPSDFTRKPLSEVHAELRVDLTSNQPRFVKK